MTNKNMDKAQLADKQVNLLSLLTVQDLALPELDKNIDKEFSLYIRSLHQNWRQGTVACLGRSDVNYTNRKPWKQKGTGRARAGSARSPLWRGGGVVFGPQERTKTLKIGRKIKQSVLYGLSLDAIKSGKVFVADWHLNHELPKTSYAYAFLKSVQLSDKKVILFLSALDSLLYASFVNIPNVKILFFDQANAFDLSGADNWLFLKKDYDLFKAMVSKWVYRV